MPDVRGIPCVRSREFESSRGEDGVLTAVVLQISHVADERPAALSATSGTWRVGTKHKARVIGHSPMDGVIMLSFEKRVLEQRFMQVSEIKVGEVMKVRRAVFALIRFYLTRFISQGTISRFTDKAIFINVSGSVDGVVWPLHYADIQLKHPEKRFKAGNTVKCRVRDKGFLGGFT
jgi:rRNA biogenesis protein RRP5